MPIGFAKAITTSGGGGSTQVSGQTHFDGTIHTYDGGTSSYWWTVPADVYSVCVLCIGGGGSGGG